MIYIKVLNILYNFLFFLLYCSVYIGCRPAAVKVPAIIFFPILPGRLNCGFAGLMTCRMKSRPLLTKADLEISTLLKKVKSAGLYTISNGKNTADNYLSGANTLEDIDLAISELKREDAQEFLFFQTDRAADLTDVTAEMKHFLADEEKYLEEKAAFIESADLEVINQRILMLKDILWILEKDVLSNLQKVLALTGMEKYSAIKPAAFRKYRKLNLVLNALDRLEVRGRDSAGIQLTFILNDEKEVHEAIRQIEENELAEDYQRRTQEGDLLNHSISVSRRQSDGTRYATFTFTYKTFSIVGELGRNVIDLRNSIQNDRILRYFAASEADCKIAVAHTRWASFGSITEENCHPVNNYTTTQYSSVSPFYPGAKAQINVVLNGDIDNYMALRESLKAGGYLIAPQITTDTKIIPLQIEKYLKAGYDLSEAFRMAVNDFEGSHAIAMTSNLEPHKTFLALKGSGQSIYIGISADQYMFSSELYGLVEVTPDFLRMNGETGHGMADGQIFVLDQNVRGIEGIAACFYDGTSIQLTDDTLQKAEITTRDIDRGNYPHYFLKEISESALSVRRTLRGKYRISTVGQSPANVVFNLGTDMVPAAVRAGLKNGAIKKIIVIGHGTAAVAGQAVADTMSEYLKDRPLNILARVASELSGFGMKDDLADTLVIPVTQSGTTTDTNRAVAMARERGAHVISIVNRRQSDITNKSHGVFYTSDGRDIEMSVASTKAFYAQIVAGQLLGLFFAQLLETLTDDDIIAALGNLESLPRLMDQVFASREIIGASVKKAINKKYWAVVGSGLNKAAADEIRIKLSELCYKTISTDIIENKKHIDLSAEPLILVCAAGNSEAVSEDVVKDVAIFKAHKAAVIVFADEGDSRFDQIADEIIGIPIAPPPLPVILNTMAGHLWGYYAARAIDEEGRIFRRFRGRLAIELEQKNERGLSIFEMMTDASFRRIINEFYLLFTHYLNSGASGTLEGKTIADLIILLKYAAGKLPLQDIHQDFKHDKDFFSPYELLDMTLDKAVDELTRPIDAIRHQAKTVTVGTSRKEKELGGIIFDLLKTLKFSMKNMTYHEILTVNRIQPAIAAVKGYTIYDVSNLDEHGNPADDTIIAVRDKGGIALGMRSRADRPTALMGVKRTIVGTGHVYIGKGKADGATIVILPLRTDHEFVTNLLLLHVEYNEFLPVSKKKDALGYRYNDIRNLVNEYNIAWDDNYLEKIPICDLFGEPLEFLAGRIREWTISGQ
jgi:glucosamine--fructose-6-phosphate aminotransferase (isomerizing)